MEPMNAAELLAYLEQLRGRGIPLDKVKVLVNVGGRDYIIKDPDYLEPTASDPTHELVLAYIG